jgi:hypothetical protein
LGQCLHKGNLNPKIKIKKMALWEILLKNSSKSKMKKKKYQREILRSKVFLCWRAAKEI